MGKHMLLYGRISVSERLKADPKSVKKIFLQEKLSVPDIERLSKEHNISLERLSSTEMRNMKASKDLQGVLARVDKFNYVSFRDLIDNSANSKLTILFLDRINDPHNLGAIVRTAACFGNFAVVIPQFNACGVTEAVLHVASGGENYVPISLVTNLSTAIIQAKDKGFWMAGAIAGSDASEIDTASFPFPLGIVLGSEGEGIRHGLQNHLDMRISIPMRGAELSFNVGVACAIFCYEVSKQRKAYDETKK